MSEMKYNLVINKGKKKGFDSYLYDKKNFVREVAKLLKKPKKIFLGLGDFLEVGDYSRLIDSIFLEKESVTFENILDKNNRRLSEDGGIPFSFFKLAVYLPDFLLKDVPKFCTKIIGEKSRLFPGAETFVYYIKEFNPTMLTAMPYEIAIEFAKRVGLSDDNLISTKYKLKKIGKSEVYAGDIEKFLSGNRRSLEIEKIMTNSDLKDEDVLYIGRGEAGASAFSTFNSIAFNPSRSIVEDSNISIYGSSLESLLVLFNFEGELEKFLLSEVAEEFLPSLLVFSEENGKNDELINLELKNLQLQNNIFGQRIESSGFSYESVVRNIEVVLRGSSIDMSRVRSMIDNRLKEYRKNPNVLVKKIYGIANERYKNFCSV